MKKLVVILSVLCFSSFVTILKLESIFASSDSSTVNVDTIEKSATDNTIIEETKDEPINIDTTQEDSNDALDTSTENSYTTKEESVSSNTAETSTKNENITSDDSVSDTTLTETDITIDDSKQSEDNSNNESTKDDPSQKDEYQATNILTQDDALNILKSMNPDLQYNYQGDENTFTVLKNKGLSGYVFLPNIDTDLGYFVDKNNSHVYYFHPSGYLELIK